MHYQAVIDNFRLELGPDRGAQPYRITYRICHLNSRGITFNVSDAAGGGYKGSQKVTRPNPSEKDSSVASNHNKGKGKALVVLQHPLWFSIRLVLV